MAFPWREHVLAVGRHWRAALVTGAVPAALSLAQGIFGFTLVLPWWGWLNIGVVGLIVAQARAWRDVTRQRDEAREQRAAQSAALQAARVRDGEGYLHEMLMRGSEQRSTFEAEKYHRDMQRERELLDRWNAMLARHAPVVMPGQFVVIEFPCPVINDSDYPSLRTYLDDDAIAFLETGHGDDITVTSGAAGLSANPYLKRLADEIGRIRKDVFHHDN